MRLPRFRECVGRRSSTAPSCFRETVASRTPSTHYSSLSCFAYQETGSPFRSRGIAPIYRALTPRVFQPRTLTKVAPDRCRDSVALVSGALVAIVFARREDFAHGGTGILPVRTAKMAVPRLGCGPAALSNWRNNLCGKMGQALFYNCDVSGFRFTKVRWGRRANGKEDGI